MQHEWCDNGSMGLCNCTHVHTHSRTDWWRRAEGTARHPRLTRCLRITSCGTGFVEMPAGLYSLPILCNSNSCLPRASCTSPIDLRPLVSLNARVAAYNSASAEDITIAFWVGHQCLIPPKKQRIHLLVDLPVRTHPAQSESAYAQIALSPLPNRNTCTILRAPPFKSDPLFMTLFLVTMAWSRHPPGGFFGGILYIGPLPRGNYTAPSWRDIG